mmetsp:Transcript_23867/g.47676  ORF Transcript_23867/g.47676 Transcript_23867/m.47676 type:complete len:83 (+) Transcript_23867:156-404(+)
MGLRPTTPTKKRSLDTATGPVRVSLKGAGSNLIPLGRERTTHMCMQLLEAIDMRLMVATHRAADFQVIVNADEADQPGGGVD